MKQKSELKRSISDRFSYASESSNDNKLKSVTFRVRIHDYAKLKVLSSRLKETPTNMAKIIFESALVDSIDAVFDLGEDVAGFAQDVEQESILLYEEVA